MNKRKNVCDLRKSRQYIRPRECCHAALQQGVEDFLAAMRRRLSLNSLVKRRSDLRVFTYYLETADIRRFQDVDRRALDKFRLWLLDRGYGESMRETCTRAVQLLLRFLAARGDLFEDPAAHLKIPKAPVTLGTVLSIHEMRRLLSAPDMATPQGFRDRTMLEVLYATGVRKGELLGMKVFDADLEQRTARVIGKNSKERVVPLGKQATQCLRAYLRDIRPKLQPKLSRQNEELWLSRERKPLGGVSVNVLIRQYAKTAGIKKAVDAHTFRRTCATHLLLGGAHPVAVAQLLGHADLTSLSHYLRTTVGDLKRAHAQTKPGQ
jgi:integrase/recombinase XerD